MPLVRRSPLVPIALTTLAITAIIVACNKTTTPTGPTPPPSGLVVTSARVTAPPIVDGDGTDAAWTSATWTDVPMQPIQVPNNPLTSSFTLRIASVHTADSIYFLVRYPDAEADETPGRLVFQGGDPANANAWTSAGNGQDGLSLMWNMTVGGQPARDAGGAFSDSAYGCTAACHTARSMQLLESGMFPDSGAVDLWHWCAGTTNPQGYADDEYAVGSDSNGTTDHSRRNKDNLQEDWFAQPNYSIGTPTLPDNVAGGDNNGLDRTRFLWLATDVPLAGTASNPMTGAAWRQGDYVPGWALGVLGTLGSELDVHARGAWAGGSWTVELSRALVTHSPAQDVEFGGAGSTTYFSVAVHENAPKYADWQYARLSNFKPPHYGCVPRRITLAIQ